MRLLSWLLVLITLAAVPAQATIIPSIPYNLTNGSLADATQVMGNFNTIVSDVNTNAAGAGVNTNITQITGLTTPLSALQGGTVVYTGGTTGGSGNAQTLSSTTPGNFTLTAGNIVTALAGFTNTGATTLNVGGTGATAMRVQDSGGLEALVGGEVQAGEAYTWYYDGTYFQLLNPSVITAANIPSTLALPNGVTATTQSSSDNTTKVATDAFVTTAVTGSFKSITIQQFTMSGTYTPNAHLLQAYVRMCGGGGGGGGAASGSGGVGAGGGGAGEYAEGVFTAATIGASQTVTLGSGGSGGASSGGGLSGSAGGTTSLGSLLTAAGGGGGQGPGSVGGSAYQNFGGAGGTGGSGTGFHFPGSNGGWAAFNIDTGGNGANSPFGSGGNGGGYPSVNPAAATGYCAGGGGTGNLTAAGAAGSGGYVIIIEYDSQ